MSQSLTKQQLQAVTHASGPLMIVAGAGTGKTTVLTERIAWLISEQAVAPKNILALTFTEKAATEMETRIDQLLPYGQTGTTVSTFHAFGQDILQSYSLESGVDETTRVLTEVEQLLFLQDHVMDLPLQTLRPLSNPVMHLRALISFFSRCKDELITAEQLKNYALSLEDPSEKQLYHELAETLGSYNKLLRENNVLDYGDLLEKTYTLLQNPRVLKSIQQKYTHILVDEYQDTNFAQTQIITQLVPPHGNITVVGDDDQSIYRFRGASVGQMDQFRLHYKDTVIVTLTENFRSTQPILDASYALIQHNNPYRLEASAHINKKLISKVKTEAIAPRVQSFRTDHHEVEWVIADIKNRIEHGAEPQDHAILVRSNAGSELFRHELEKEGIPFTSDATTNLQNDPTVQLLVNFLKSAANPHDTLSLFFLATSPVYGVAGAELIPTVAESKNSHKTLEMQWKATPDLSAKLSELVEDLESARNSIPTSSTSDVLLHWINTHNLIQKLTSDNPDDDQRIAKVLQAFFTLVQRFERSSTQKSVLHFLDNLELLFSQFDEREIDPELALLPNAVRVFTVHMAKGLEFPVVYVTNLVQERFPVTERERGFQIPQALLHGASDEGEHLREERRLMYVAMTRAKQELLMTHAQKYGAGKRIRKPSIFLSELDLPQLEENVSDVPNVTTLPDLDNHSSSSDVFHISPHQIEDYLTCPLRYRYSAIDKLPVPDAQPQMVGRAIHASIEHYFAQRKEGSIPTISDLTEVLDTHWSSVGFISAKHEEERHASVKQDLHIFLENFLQKPVPQQVEVHIELHLDTAIIHGRIDTVFEHGLSEYEGPVIIDFKTSDLVTTQEQADKKAKTSLQLTLYALAWKQKTGINPYVGLYFTASGLFGITQKTERQLQNAEKKVAEVVQGIRERDFEATPSSFTCSICPYQNICPSSMAH